MTSASGALVSSSMALARDAKLAAEFKQSPVATHPKGSGRPRITSNQYNLSSRAQALEPACAPAPAPQPSIASLLVVSLAFSSLLLPFNGTSHLFVSSHSVPLSPLQASQQQQQQRQYLGNVGDKLSGAHPGENHVIKLPGQVSSHWAPNDLHSGTSGQPRPETAQEAPATRVNTMRAAMQPPSRHVVPWNESVWWMLDKVLDGSNYTLVVSEQPDSEAAADDGGEQDEIEEDEAGEDGEMDTASEGAAYEIGRDNSTASIEQAAPIHPAPEPEPSSKDKSTASGEVLPSSTRDNTIETSLVHQLGDLLMTNKPDVIVRTIAKPAGSSPGEGPDVRPGSGAREISQIKSNSADQSWAEPVKGRQASAKEQFVGDKDARSVPAYVTGELRSSWQPEARPRFGRASNQFPPLEEFSTMDAAHQQQHQQVDGDGDNGAGSEDSYANAQAAGGLNNEQAITCSPDDDFQTIMVDQASTNEVFNGPGGSGAPMGGSLNNLTLEQRQQLLNEAGSSGLLGAGTRGQSDPAGGQPFDPDQEADGVQQQHQQQHQYRTQAQTGQGTITLIGVGTCVPKGSQMIELITKIITPILFSIIIVVGLLGNIIVMLVILEDRKLERELTPTNLLILDLSLADLSFIILCIPFTGWDYAVGHWVFGSLWCKFNQYLIVACALSSIYTLVLMSIDRFMAIVYPIKCLNYRTSKNMLHAIVIKWIVILVIASPTAMMHGLVDSPRGPDHYSCRFLIEQYNPLHFQIIFFMTSYLFPLILIFCLYLSLLNKLWFGQKPHGHKESHKMLESKKRVTWLVASIVIVFAICWFPIQIMLILMRLQLFKYTATYVAVQVFAHTLGYMNSCVNPIVYAFASETFNQSFKKSWLGRYWCLCCYRNPSHYYNNPTNGLSSTYNNNNNNTHTVIEQIGSTAGGSMLTSISAPNNRNSARKSLQVIPMSNNNNKNHFGVSPRNQSLNNIYSPQAASSLVMTTSRLQQEARPMTSVLNDLEPVGGSGQARSSPPPPPPKLEPRDRFQVPQPAGHGSPSPSAAARQSFAHNSATGSAGPKLQEQQQNQIDVSISVQQQQQQQQQLVPRQPTASPKVFHSLQKQQLVARMVNDQSNSNQVVAHQCEPCNDF